MSADWNLWSEIPHTELWKAVALSMDIEPAKLPGYDRSSVRDPFFNFPFHKCPEEFKRRLEIAMKHLGHKFPAWLIHEPLWTSEVDMMEMRKWTASLNSPWSSPENFPQFKSTKDSSKGTGHESNSGERQLLKRQAFINQMRPRWPTIEHDLNEASRNKLNSAKSKGKWDVEKATKWAIGLGKLKSASDTRMDKMSSFPWS